VVKKQINSQDPHYDREAAKYDCPVPSREYVLTLLEQFGKPVRTKELLDMLQLDSDKEQQAMQTRIRAMLRDGQLHLDRRGRIGMASTLELIRGQVRGHPDGFGFLIPDDNSEDLFISPRHMRKLVDGDIVLVQEITQTRPGQREAIIHELLERPAEYIVGMLVMLDGLAYVEPENKRITHTVHIPDDELHDAEDGQMVMIQLISVPIKGQLLGKVVEIIGDFNAPGMEIDIALRSHNIPFLWPQAVTCESAKLSELPAITAAKRRDCRDLAFVTIDGEDAQDFDDAVYSSPHADGGWRLWVAIADVSHYVKPSTAIDSSAQERGNSVYFPGTVIPMLPEVLCNNLCSLLPQTDRYGLICEMRVSATGTLQSAEFYEGVIHSKARLTYTEVAEMLVARNPELLQKYQELVPHLESLYSLYQALLSSRKIRGAMEFDSSETKIIFDDQRKISDIVPTKRNDAHRLIEECMLLANVATAQFLAEQPLPALYRVHAPPKAKRVTELREFLAKLGLSLGGDKIPTPLNYANLLEVIQLHPDRHMIQTVVLRSLCQAVYTSENAGHFGLAYPAYTHFTSPIRRYPDLLTHRAIKKILKIPGYPYDYDPAMIENLGCRLSATERRADDATRDVVLALKCEYMLDHIGAEFTGVVSSVVNFGLFIELIDLYVDGLLHVTALPGDYYNFDPVMHKLTGERTGQSYKIGDQVRVRVTRVDLNDHKIDFELA
jgi:ribonuclease R